MCLGKYNYQYITNINKISMLHELLRQQLTKYEECFPKFYKKLDRFAKIKILKGEKV